MGVFIEIEVDQAALGPDASRALVSLCPVEIFAIEIGQVIVRPERVDECTLCELCLAAAPANAIHIRKRYKDETLVSHGGGLKTLG